MEGPPRTLKSGQPIDLVFDHDLAGLVRNILRHDFNVKNHILATDGITRHDFDFIDMGKVLEPSDTVPVTIKSLLFQFRGQARCIMHRERDTESWGLGLSRNSGALLHGVFFAVQA